jgi:hypothetical protein
VILVDFEKSAKNAAKISPPSGPDLVILLQVLDLSEDQEAKGTPKAHWLLFFDRTIFNVSR